MKLDMFPYDAIDIAAVLDALHLHGFIAKYEVDAEVYGFIPTWTVHQTINAREPDSELPIPDSTCIVMHVHARADTCVHVWNGNGNGNGKGRELEGKGNGVGKGASSRVRQPEQLSDVTAHFLIAKSTAEEAEAFYSHYEAQGWKAGNGMVITNWRAKADSWIKNNRERKAANGTRKQEPTDGRGGERTFAAVAEESAARRKRWGIDGGATKDEPSLLAGPSDQQLANGT